MRRNVAGDNFSDVPFWPFIEICFVRDLGVSIRIGRENTSASCGLESEPHSSDSAEEIDESRPCVPLRKSRFRVSVIAFHTTASLPSLAWNCIFVDRNLPSGAGIL